MSEQTEFMQYLDNLLNTYVEHLKSAKPPCLRNSLQGKIEVIRAVKLKYHYLVTKTKTQ